MWRTATGGRAEVSVTFEMAVSGPASGEAVGDEEKRRNIRGAMGMACEAKKARLQLSLLATVVCVFVVLWRCGRKRGFSEADSFA